MRAIALEIEASAQKTYGRLAYAAFREVTADRNYRIHCQQTSKQIGGCSALTCRSLKDERMESRPCH